MKSFCLLSDPNTDQVFQPVQRDGLRSGGERGADGGDARRGAAGTVLPLHGASAPTARTADRTEKR